MKEAAFKIKGEIMREKILLVTLNEKYRNKKDKLLLNRCVNFKKIENKLVEK